MSTSAAAPEPSTVEDPPRPAAPSTARIAEIDAVRGFALCGILLVNLPDLARMEWLSPSGKQYPVRWFLDLAVQHRFFPIFSFLFGLSVALFLTGARDRSVRPRLALLRRLAALGVFGAAHQFIHPGEALLVYAIVGLVVLLPATWLPAPFVLATGVLLSVAALAVGGEILLVPGLFLLGLATARFGPTRLLPPSRTRLLALLAVVAPTGAAATWWQYSTTHDLDPTVNEVATAAAGLLAATAYVLVLLLFLRGPLGRILSAALVPLGRMALTNYVTATVLVIATVPMLGLRGSGRWGTALALAVAVLAVQAVASRWWLVRFRYGPVEWCLRCVTWWRVVPNPIIEYRCRGVVADRYHSAATEE